MQIPFRLGQLVRPKPSLSDRPDNRAYCIVGILPATGGTPIYVIKNTVGTERMIAQDEIEPAPERALP